MNPRTLALLLPLLAFTSPTMAENTENRAADIALADARRFADDGNYAEALERHLWYHDHALESAPSQYGVRLSFALSDWRRLGEKYPPALEALRRVRDAKTARLAGGEENRELFHDVAAINAALALGEPEATATLFRKLDERSPAFATRVVDLADEALVARGEYALLRKHLGDPDKVFARAKSSLAEGLDYSRTSPDPESSRAAFERIFSERITRLVVTLRETGERETAARIRREALAMVDSPALRETLPE